MIHFIGVRPDSEVCIRTGQQTYRGYNSKTIERTNYFLVKKHRENYLEKTQKSKYFIARCAESLVGYWMLDVGCSMLGARYSVLDARYSMLDER